MAIKQQGRLVLADFSGGRSTLKAIDLIADNESPDQENTWNEVGGLSQRRGFTTTVINISSKTVAPGQMKTSQLAGGSLQRLMMLGYVSGDAANYLCHTEDGTSFAFDGYGVGTVSITGSTVTGTGTAWLTHAAAGDKFKASSAATYTNIQSVDSDTQLTLSSAPGNVGGGTAYLIIQKIASGHPNGMALFDQSGAQNLFIADGARAYRYDGTNVYRTDNGTVLMPTGKQLLSHKNYLFSFLHDNTTVRWCNLKDATTWPAANSQTVALQGDIMRGAVIYGDYIVIFTRSRMYRLLGDIFDPTAPQYILQRINTPPNFLFKWPRSAVIHKGFLKFLANDGWYAYIGGPGIEKMTTDIQPDVDGFYLNTYSSESLQDSAVAIVWKDRMWCSVPDNSKTPTQNDNAIYVMDERNHWHKWPTAAASAAGEITDFETVSFGTGGVYNLMAGGIATNKIATMDTGNADDGGAISGYFITKEFTFPNDITFVYARVTMKLQSAGNLVFGYSIDRRAFISSNLDMTTGAGTVITRNVPINRMGKAIRFKFSNSTVNQTFEVYKVELFWEPSEAMRA